MIHSTSDGRLRGNQTRVVMAVLVDSAAATWPYGTRKGTLLESVPLGVTTWTSPVVAPAGTVVVISELDTTVKVAAVPLKLTLPAP